LSRTREELVHIYSIGNRSDQLFYQQNVKIVPIFESKIQRDIKFNIYSEFLEQKKAQLETRIVEVAN
jgi:hypothetical protein